MVTQQPPVTQADLIWLRSICTEFLRVRVAMKEQGRMLVTVQAQLNQAVAEITSLKQKAGPDDLPQSQSVPVWMMQCRRRCSSSKNRGRQGRSQLPRTLSSTIALGKSPSWEGSWLHAGQHTVLEAAREKLKSSHHPGEVCGLATRLPQPGQYLTRGMQWYHTVPMLS